MAKLYLVGMPIGNLKDITLRALDTLREVDYIACEDTRVIRRICSHFQLKCPPLIVYNDHNKLRVAPQVMKLILDGKNVAQVPDAGMPTINDPGFRLVQEALAQAISVEVIPGVSAVTITSALANFDSHFAFHGFLHYKTTQRRKQLQHLQPGTHIFFLSPHRLRAELNAIKETCGPQTVIFLGRELTKKFESHYRGTITSVIAQIPAVIRGELTIAIQIAKEVNHDQ